MHIVDLGPLDGPILAFGGPLSNLHALEALIAEADRLGIPSGNTICTGDLAGYCAHPAETVATMRSLGIATIAGNVERQLASGAMDCGCGFDPGSTCDRLSAGWYAHVDQRIGQEARDWMRSLPDILTFTHSGRRAAVIHGGVQDISRFVWPNAHDDVLAQERALIEQAAGPVSFVISGHCGIPFTKNIKEAIWLNAGVIGMPPHDGKDQTRYALIQDGTVEIRTLVYNATAARAAMETVGLTQGYHAALTSGWWPSEDILPPSLRRPTTSLV